MNLSVIVPTYNEVDNIRPLCERLFKSLRSEKSLKNSELIYVDDESAGSAKTESIVNALVKEGFPVRIHMRRKIEGRGLSSAVLLGFSMAKYDTVLCMDADLQHEPEAVFSVAKPVLDKKAEFTVGSRYCGGGGFGFDWAIHRRIISHGATMLAWGVSSSSDPMSGFFCTRKDVIARAANRINPIGFKIALEIMARTKAQPVVDVPITFQSRLAGESKLSMKQNVLYLQQLAALYWDRRPIACVVFLAVVLMLIYQVVAVANIVYRMYK
jgi:dolichol-phosphate mannosyltransferase